MKPSPVARVSSDPWPIWQCCAETEDGRCSQPTVRLSDPLCPDHQRAHERYEEHQRRLEEAANPHDWTVLDSPFTKGDRVILTVDGVQEVHGVFALCFDDDDPVDDPDYGQGRGKTFRIVADDGEVWEALACRPE